MSEVLETKEALDTKGHLFSVLNDVFGFEQFRPLQREIIEKVLDNQDQLVVMPTGQGKSLCFQLPSLIRRGVGIVVSPLIALMEDQVSQMQACGVRAAFYNSSLDMEQSRQVLSKLHQGELDLLYIAPERLLSAHFLSRLEEIEVALFAIDEAHCISQWGHDFRPEYRSLGRLKQEFPHIPMIALTATADAQTQCEIIKGLGLIETKVHIASFDRPNLRYHIVEKTDGLKQLKRFLYQHANMAGIVYCSTRFKVEQICTHLIRHGFAAKSYHAGLDTALRKQVQRQFQRDEIEIIVATVAFGMGIDKPNVRFVVHYDIPKSIESYYQETGRAGRDGLQSDVLMLYSLSDCLKVKSILTNNASARQRAIVLHKFEAMLAFAESNHCRRRALLHYFGEEKEANCGQCDICLHPPSEFDATIDAQKILSCIYRVGQNFGQHHVIDVLRGKKTKRILQVGHDSLSTFGVGKHGEEKYWLSILRQLMYLGFCQFANSDSGILQLTSKAIPLLKSSMHLKLSKPRGEFHSLRKAGSTVDGLQYDHELFETLRALRKRLASRWNKPPFMIFSDASLVEMAALKPTDIDQFSTISGVGHYKLETFSSDFIAAIQQHEWQTNAQNEEY